MAKAIEKLAEHPSITPEGAEQYYKQAFGIRTSDVNKKLPKEWENLATEVAPKFGQSWLGGQTTNKMEVKNMPIPSSLEGQPTQTQPPMPPSQYEAPMPQPPPGAQRSAFHSPQELSKQKMTAAVEMLQALGPIQQQQALETERAKLAMQPDDAFPFAAEAGLATRSGKVLREPELKPVTPPSRSNLQSIEITLPGQSGPQPAMRQLDPDDLGNLGKIFVRTPEGLQDVTAQARLYEKPAQPPFIIRSEAAVSAAASELPREWRNAITRAMPSNAPQAVRLARLNEAASYIDAGDTEGLKSRIRQLAIEGENVGTQAQVEGRADAMAAMKDAISLIDNMQREGVSTNILTGTWEDIMRKLGTTSHSKRV